MISRRGFLGAAVGGIAGAATLGVLAIANEPPVKVLPPPPARDQLADLYDYARGGLNTDIVISDWHGGSPLFCSIQNEAWCGPDLVMAPGRRHLSFHNFYTPGTPDQYDLFDYAPDGSGP